MSVGTHISEDVFLHVPFHPPKPQATRHVIFFIPGNPGLLGFYHKFLSLLSASGPSSTCTVAGFSLGGFSVGPTTSSSSGSSSSEDRTASVAAAIQHPPAAPCGPIYSLQDQIALTHARLDALVAALPTVTPGAADGAKRNRHSVVLVGHSVGAYIALEVIRRRHAAHASRGSGASSSSYAVRGAVLLTPTIVDIARSSHGRVMAPLLTYAPFLEGLAQWAAWGFVRVVPGGILQGVVARVTGMRGEGLRTVLAWLGSGMGVRQTVVMGGQEMREIMGGEGWGEEVWGVGEMGEEGWKGAPRLVLYFARRDHWVADVTRDGIVEARRRRDGEGGEDRSWPRIEVEESGRLVHGWCLEQSKEVAVKVRKWIEEIIE